MKRHQSGPQALNSLASRWIIPTVNRLASRLLGRKPPDTNSFLKQVKGLIHVGANLGQERDLYAAHGLNVLWIEPIPSVYRRLNELIASHPKQKACCHLITDVDDREYAFHISSNEGESSSIFELGEHKKMWPDVSYTKTITLRSVTLSTLVKQMDLDLTAYDALVLDTQGSEMLVLQGAVDILPGFRFIKTEVADFESYQGCCRFSDMDRFLRGQGFRLTAKASFACKTGVGSYFEVVYARR